MNPVWIEELIEKYKRDIGTYKEMSENNDFDIDTRIRYTVRMHTLKSVVRDLEVTLKEHA